MLASWVIACGAEPELECAPATLDDILEVRESYYLCLDSLLDCGPGGYPLGYGARYAERFLVDVRPGLSAAGQAFLDAVSVCLQQRMDGFFDDQRSCSDVWDFGFASHPDCYVESGFCELDLDDQLIIADAVDPADRELPEQRAQVLEVAGRCAAAL